MTSDRRNVTVVLDEETARWVRVEAARADKSVSQYLGDLLEERRRRVEGYDAARERYLSAAPRVLRRDGGPLPGRERLHDRAGVSR